MKRTIDILPCFIRIIVNKLLQNRVSRGFADFFAQYLSILKEFWAVSHSQILCPCGFPNFSARNHWNFNTNNDLNIFFSTFLRMNHYFYLCIFIFIRYFLNFILPSYPNSWTLNSYRRDLKNSKVSLVMYSQVNCLLTNNALCLINSCLLFE